MGIVSSSASIAPVSLEACETPIDFRRRYKSYVIPSATVNKRARTAMANLSVQNILAGLKGEHVPECVNPEVYE